MTIHPSPAPEDAVRRVLADTVAADFCDIVREVNRRFGIRVSEGLVEQLYLENKKVQSRAQEPPSEPPKRVPAIDAHDEALALRFVEVMGGFPQARAAIDGLERSVRALDR